ncbi:hypothetical protein HPP92_022481 [Vanilla planifolia]|uniref:Uncharacterized protein n=1 Tax=Vanilla planifolia TaxID=51239 RepID=A0A835PPR7_VANPL|nr:hypothetical protein HPP92_022481 [Vanilla planifolia]
MYGNEDGDGGYELHGLDHLREKATETKHVLSGCCSGGGEEDRVVTGGHNGVCWSLGRGLNGVKL